ncbi:RNA-directed RNA polymerase [ssRNA phage SRR5467091_14]|uniref:RNA-directed RNA polymerase n=1 Tax=ssRNA phage SRR5467091_14 TaxID=2786464 RepID=A0A8S5L495_9VIRU|nr:RNA-directed RNA polymerase [ssRNA phage SRR5467091_14]DAD52497.1 TPA_asm: RNA-directed RNA polymerase [ssRNA phage SRR5467091_14]
MKQSLDMVLNPLAAVIEDCSAWNPRLAPNLSSDLSRLNGLVRTRGIGIVLLDLPELGSLVDSGLKGRLQTEAIPHTLGSWEKGTVLFKSLLLEVFTTYGAVHDPLPDPDAVYFLRQVLYLYKKLDVECPKDRVADAVRKFCAINQSLRSPTYPWWETPRYFLNDVNRGGAPRFLDSYFQECREDQEGYLIKDVMPPRHPTLNRALLCLDMVVDHVMSDLPMFDYRDIVPSHGPGAVSDIRTGSDKYLFPNWSRRNETVFPEDYFTYNSEESAGKSPPRREGPPLDVYGRLLAVPKTFKGPRLITAEPTAHQFLQQGLMKWLRRSLPRPLRDSIDFKSQEPSRELSLKASKDGKLATVDLSSASDRLSLWTIERVFGRNRDLLMALYASRTVWVVDHTTKEAKDGFVLKMFAGQGNACTFTVQSMVYAMCCFAAYIAYHHLPANRRTLRRAAKETRVFGDDLIVPTEVLPYLGVILNFLQLKVNAGKTCYSGAFRESCGMDAYDGYDVSPLYLSTLEPGATAESLVSWLDVSNNAHQKGLWHLSSYMDEVLEPKVRRLAPVANRPQQCLSRYTFVKTGVQFVRERYNVALQRTEGLGLVPEAVETRVTREDGRMSLLQYFLEARSREPGDNLAHLRDSRESQLGYTAKTKLRLKRRWVREA